MVGALTFSLDHARLAAAIKIYGRRTRPKLPRRTLTRPTVSFSAVPSAVPLVALRSIRYRHPWIIRSPQGARKGAQWGRSDASRPRLDYATAATNPPRSAASGYRFLFYSSR